MLDEYFRNGKLFLSEVSEEQDIPITEDFIHRHFRDPVKELVGESNVGDKTSEKEMLRALRKYFEISGKSINIGKIVEASFSKTRDGYCSYCGKESAVFSNRAYVFPFERKIDSIAPEEARQQFCLQCGFTLFSGMAYLYKRGDIMFFFDSVRPEYIKKMSIPFKEDLRDPSNFNKLKKLSIQTFHSYETIFVIMFEFVKHLYRKKLVKDYEGIVNNVRLILVAGSGQIFHQIYIEGTTLDRISQLCIKLIEGSVENWKKREEEKKEKLKIFPEDLIFLGFFNNLTINRGKLSENCREREEFTKMLLDGRVDFITLNNIVMERLKRKEKFSIPLYYRSFIQTYMEVFDLDKEIFEKVNGLGYALGKQMKGTNLENFVWDVFRARGVEQFYSTLVELQAKLKTSIDLRTLNEYEQGWREAKAILLNGMLNALYGGR